MAKMKDAGISTGGNFIAPKLVLDQRYIFEIVSADYREPHGEFKEQVEFGIRFYNADRQPAGETYRFSMGYNDVRAKLITFFREYPGEVINGIDEENGLVLALGSRAIKGNKPMLFADADWDRDAVFPAVEDSADSIPF